MENNHYYCPKCKTREELKTTIRKNIELDYCPTCNGLWLDNGELKKLISHYVKKALENERELFELQMRADARTMNKYDESYKSRSVLNDLFDLSDLADLGDFSDLL